MGAQELRCIYLCDEIHEFRVLELRIEAQRNDRKRERLYCSLGFDNSSFIFLCLRPGAVVPWLGRCALLFPWQRLTLDTSTSSSYGITLPLQSRLIYQFFWGGLKAWRCHCVFSQDKELHASSYLSSNVLNMHRRNTVGGSPGMN